VKNSIKTKEVNWEKEKIAGVKPVDSKDDPFLDW